MREARHVVTIGTIVLLGACAAIQRQDARQTESVLSAAGFQMRPADTPERIEHLKTMRPLKIVPHMKDGRLLYVYADPKNCGCLYVGDEAAYERFHQLALQKQIAQEQLMTAQMNEDAAMNWGLWGPLWW